MVMSESISVRPAMTPALLGRTDTLGNRGLRLAEPVHDGQDPAAEGAGLPTPGVLSDLGATAQSHWSGDYPQRRS